MSQATDFVPLVDLEAQYRAIRGDLAPRLAKVLGDFRFVLGPEVAELESALAGLTGVRHAICVANGTDALKIPLMARAIGPGDAVFVPAFTFVATAEVVAEVGATPVFVDIAPDSYNMEPADLEARVTAVIAEGKLRPRAVIPVDLYGQPADYKAIGKIAARHGLLLIGDAAQSFGATQNGACVGSLAPVTATSFYPSKPLGCYGDGGCLFTDDDELAVQLRSIARHGFGPESYLANHIGLNSRLDTLQAAVLLAKLTVFQDELRARAAAAQRYCERLDGLVGTPKLRAGNRSAWGVFTIETERRDTLRAHLSAAGIASAIYYATPLHLHPAYAAFTEGEGSLPVSEAVSRRVLAMPMHGYLDETTLERICDAVVAGLS